MSSPDVTLADLPEDGRRVSGHPTHASADGPVTPGATVGVADPRLTLIAEAFLREAELALDAAVVVPGSGDGEPVRPDDLYQHMLVTSVRAAAAGDPAPRAIVRLADGGHEPFLVDRWLAPSSGADDEVVERSRGPVLDIGCGPGRLLEALEAAGKSALGVDLAPIAVGIARSRGAQAVAASIFSADVPDAGRWRTALLIDGNIGIGGVPAALLRRVRRVLAPGGEVIVELDGPGVGSETSNVRIEADGVVSDWFPWARVGVDGIEAVTHRARMDVAEVFEADMRWFARLSRD